MRRIGSLIIVLVVLIASMGLVGAQIDPTPTPEPTATVTPPPVVRPLGWDVKCVYRYTKTIDPIVMPDTMASSHFHDIFGARVTRLSTYDSLRLANGNGCANFLDDESGYWVPKLSDRNGVQMLPRQLNVYYRVSRDVDPQTVQPWPQGLEVISGFHGATDTQYILDDPNRPFPVWFCGGAGNGREGDATVPHDCLDPLYPFVVVSIPFPSCSNGLAQDPANHRDHVAFPTTDGCPATHPFPYPTSGLQISYASSLGTGAYLDSNYQEPRTTNGMHADFMDGWSQEEVAFLIERCVKSGAGCGPKRPTG